MAPSEYSAELMCTCTGIGINPSTIDNLFKSLFICLFLLVLNGITHLILELGVSKESNWFFEIWKILKVVWVKFYFFIFEISVYIYS